MGSLPSTPRTVVRNLERAGVSRSVAMKMTVHKTESAYRRYAIVSEADLREAGLKLAAMRLAADPRGCPRWLPAGRLEDPGQLCRRRSTAFEGAIHRWPFGKAVAGQIDPSMDLMIEGA